MIPAGLLYMEDITKRQARLYLVQFQKNCVLTVTQIQNKFEIEESKLIDEKTICEYCKDNQRLILLLKKKGTVIQRIYK